MTTQKPTATIKKAEATAAKAATEVKAAATKAAADVKPVVDKAVAEVKPVVAKAVEETKKTADKAAKVTAKKADEAKKTVTKAATKASTDAKVAVKTAAKAIAGDLKTELHVQFAGKSYSESELVKIAKDVWVFDLQKKVDDLTSVQLYVKPEENAVYYVMNGQYTGSFYI